MVPNKLYWDVNSAVGLPKQRNSYQSSPTFPCFENHIAYLRPSIIHSAPGDRIVQRPLTSIIGPLQDSVTWYGINYAGTQITQWDFQNKGKSDWTGKSSFVLKVPLRYLRPSIIYSVPCDRILQRAYRLRQQLTYKNRENEKFKPSIFPGRHQYARLPFYNTAW